MATQWHGTGNFNFKTVSSATRFTYLKTNQTDFRYKPYDNPYGGPDTLGKGVKRKEIDNDTNPKPPKKKKQEKTQQT